MGASSLYEKVGAVMGAILTEDRWARLAGAVLVATVLVAAWAAAPAGAVTINEATRTVTASRLSMAFSTIGPDVVREVKWIDSANVQGANLAQDNGQGACATKQLSDPANFWGESYGTEGESQPKLVYDGSEGSWTSPASNQVQTSTDYPAACLGPAVPVSTTYTYYDEGPAANEIMMQRTWRFDLVMNPPIGKSAFLRAYVPQLPLAEYGQVLYPSNGTLIELGANQCKVVCEKAFSDGWFAIDDATPGSPDVGSGVIVLRDPSDSPGAQLAIQSSEEVGVPNPKNSNLSSIALPIGSGALTSALSETEYLCFYDEASWPPAQRRALELPAGCGPVPLTAGGPGGGSPAGAGASGGGGASSGGGGGAPGPPRVLPPPVLGHSFNVAPAAGSVLVELPGTHTFGPLTQAVQLPFGAIIDATHGTVTITTATAHGATQTGQFFDGEFVLKQGRDGAVLAVLAGGDFAACPTVSERRHLAHAGAGPASASSLAGAGNLMGLAWASSGHTSAKHVVRKLWANAHGKFSTQGNYAAGAVQGTEWLTEDRCDGTLIAVTRDRVAVTNLVSHRHLSVRTGHSYFAKAP
jgi:hypothetical protein